MRSLNIIVLGLKGSFNDYELLCESAENIGIKSILTPSISPIFQRNSICILHSTFLAALLFAALAPFKSGLFLDIRTVPIRRTLISSIHLRLIRVFSELFAERLIFQDSMVACGFRIKNFSGPYAPLGYTSNITRQRKHNGKIVYFGSVNGRMMGYYFKQQMVLKVLGSREIDYFGSIEDFVELRSITTSRVNYMGQLSRIELLQAISHYEFGISFIGNPVYDYQVPTKIYDCISAGIPIVTSASPAVMKYFAETEGVLIIGELDEEALLKKLGSINRNLIRAEKPFMNEMWSVWLEKNQRLFT